MIIDLILDRRDGVPYDPYVFYNEMMDYYAVFPDLAAPIVRALDWGTEKDVKKAICGYIMDQGYNPDICAYVNAVKWF